MNMVDMVKANGNPQQLVIQMLQERMGNTPMGQNLLSLAGKGDTASIEQIARNMVSQRGLDFDVEFNKFKKTFGL